MNLSNLRAPLGMILTCLLLWACQPDDATPPALGTTPVPRNIDYDWMTIAEWQQQHDEDSLLAEQGEAEVIFLGDSITAGWHWPLWEAELLPFNAVNFGIGGDHTGNMLWRLQNGAAGKLEPRLVVLLAGVNNIGHLNETPEQVFQGVQALVRQLRTSFPQARILVNGVFPFEQFLDSPKRSLVRELNSRLATLDDGQWIRFRDYGDRFLEEDGSISPAIMGDFLHLTPEGYARWADALLPDIRQWLAEESSDMRSIPAADSHVQIMGRYLTLENGGIRLGYPGVTLNLAAKASRGRLLARSSGEQSHLEILLDDQAPRLVRLTSAWQEIPLFIGAEEARHRVRIIHSGETWHGQVEIAGFQLDGELLPPTPLSARKLLVLGDSVTCGEAVFRESHCRKGTHWWRPRLSYAMLAAEALDAQVHLVCYGGRGLVRSWDGKTDDLNLPDFFELAIADPAQTHAQTHAWDHDRYQPDLILSAIGTNDFSQGIPDAKQYIDTYLALVHRLHQLHPQAVIALTEGAILSGDKKAALVAYLDQVVAAADDPGVHFLPSATYPGDDCDAHPTGEQHAAMAKDLVPHLRFLLRDDSMPP